jgi:hypothetical protein
LKLAVPTTHGRAPPTIFATLSEKDTRTTGAGVTVRTADWVVLR